MNAEANEPAHDKVHLHDSKLRSVLKGLTWRILATTTTVIIAYLIMGDASGALKIGSIEFFAKFAVYYFHERAWAKVPLGTIRRITQ